jgi:hypothetical protein
MVYRNRDACGAIREGQAAIDLYCLSLIGKHVEINEYIHVKLLDYDGERAVVEIFPNISRTRSHNTFTEAGTRMISPISILTLCPCSGCQEERDAVTVTGGKR